MEPPRPTLENERGCGSKSSSQAVVCLFQVFVLPVSGQKHGQPEKKIVPGTETLNLPPSPPFSQTTHSSKHRRTVLYPHAHSAVWSPVCT